MKVTIIDKPIRNRRTKILTLLHSLSTLLFVCSAMALGAVAANAVPGNNIFEVRVWHFTVPIILITGHCLFMWLMGRYGYHVALFTFDVVKGTLTKAPEIADPSQ